MEFNDARVVDSLCFQMKQADWQRSLNRTRINDLFNGVPPYDEDEAEENAIEINVNELSGTVAAHDARSQFYNGFLKPGNYFTASTDAGPKHRRQAYGKIITNEVNKRMKRSIAYTECFRSKFAMDVLHGIAPASWVDADSWCPESLAIGDVMIPANTRLTMRNLPFFAIYRSFTAPELIALTRGPSVDPGWNLPLVENCLKWVDEHMLSLQGNNWREIWSPEKTAERIHADGGFYAGDQAPTIDCWDFYYWSDADKKNPGWQRRMVLDAWSEPGLNQTTYQRRQGSLYTTENLGQFLFNPGTRKWGNNLSEIITWQFADLSAVSPFKYHTVRSLGFLLYGVCHLQNRLYCKFSEAQFEQLMVYFRVRSQDEAQRALKIDLVNRGFIDDTIEFVKAQDRYQVNTPLVQLGLQQNTHIIGRNSASYTSNPGGSQDQRQLTATQWLGEANKVTSLVSSAMNQAYLYQTVEYREILRRFMKKHSSDPDVKAFQAACARQGVPDGVLYNFESWDVEPERVVGAGNKTLEMGVAEWLMQHINLYDPEPQKLIKRTATLAVTDDPALTDALVPDAPVVTDSIHDAQLAAGTLLQGLPLALKSGVNHIEYIETLMASMALVVKKITERDNVGTMDEVMGLQNIAQHIAQHIAILNQDKGESQRVKQYGDELGQMMNLVKAFAQRLAEQMQQQQQAGGGVDPETQAKIQSMMALTQAKAQNTRESHAQRTAQRQAQWELEHERRKADAVLDLKIKAAEANAKNAAERPPTPV